MRASREEWAKRVERWRKSVELRGGRRLLIPVAFEDGALKRLVRVLAELA